MDDGPADPLPFSNELERAIVTIVAPQEKAALDPIMPGLLS
jgi:hypothetical protein